MSAVRSQARARGTQRRVGRIHRPLRVAVLEVRDDVRRVHDGDDARVVEDRNLDAHVAQAAGSSGGLRREPVDGLEREALVLEGPCEPCVRTG